MAEIPSDIAGSAAQAGFQAREVGRQRDATRTGQAHAAQQQTRAVTEASELVDTAELGTRVFSDAEGGGGQGRAFESSPEEETSSELDSNGSQDTPGGPGDARPRLDIQA